MLKIRLMGTAEDIAWFKKIIEENPETKILDSSELFSNKGTSKYFRSYLEIQKSENMNL